MEKMHIFMYLFSHKSMNDSFWTVIYGCPVIYKLQAKNTIDVYVCIIHYT